MMAPCWSWRRSPRRMGRRGDTVAPFSSAFSAHLLSLGPGHRQLVNSCRQLSYPRGKVGDRTPEPVDVPGARTGRRGALSTARLTRMPAAFRNGRHSPQAVRDREVELLEDRCVVVADILDVIADIGESHPTILRRGGRMARPPTASACAIEKCGGGRD